MATIRVTRLSTECHIYEPEDFEPEDSCCPHPEAYIEIIAQIETQHTYYKLLRHPLHHLTHPSTSTSLISRMLSAAAVPLPALPAAVREIGDCVRAIAARPHNKNRKTIPVVVTLSVVESQSQPLLVQEEDVAVADLECPICMEEMVMAVRLPCSHLFHESCIARWLDHSAHCPLCRSCLNE